MALPKKLNDTDIKTILSATERFEYMYTDDRKNLWFWEKRWENEISIKQGISMQELIKWIVDFFKKDSHWEGKNEVQTDIKKALGINL